MRILYPLVSHQIGGGNRSILTLFSGLAPLGVDPIAVCPAQGQMTAACAEAHIDCRVVPHYLKPSWREPWTSWQAYQSWKALLADTSPALVHSNGFPPAQAISLAARQAGRRHICHVRFGETKEYLDWVFRGLPKPDLFIFNSEALAAEVRPRLQVNTPGAEFEVVHNAVDLSLFQPAPRAPGPPRVGIVANLWPVKGHDDFLQMARTLTDRGVEAQYWVIGGDLYGSGYDAKVHALADSLGLRERVTFFGHRSDIPTLMAQLDLLVCASHVEPFGRVLIEAMACEKPVVATRVGGIPEVVADGETGVLVPPHAAGDLADAVGGLLASAETMSRYGAAGRRRAIALFNADTHAARIKTIYDRLV
jgi:glycosyltransferase involved in cell wall biosynthesis